MGLRGDGPTPRNASADKDDWERRWPVQLPAPMVHKGSVSGLLKTSLFGVKTACQKACILGLFQNLMINSAYVRTALVLSSDRDPNRVPRKYTRTESSSRVHVCCPGGSPAWLPRHPRPLWLVYPANTRHCGKYVAWRGAAGPALGGCTVSWELTKTPQKAGGNPFMQQSPKDPQARFSAWPTRG